MTCEELLAALNDYVGGELVVEVRETFEVHLRSCARCGALVSSYAYVTRATRVLPRCPLPPAFEARLRAVLEAEMKKGEAPAS